MEKLDIIREWEQDETFQALPFRQKSVIFKRFFDEQIADDAFKTLPANLQNRAKNRFVASQIYPEETISQETPRYSLMERALKRLGVPIAREKGISDAARARGLVEHQAREEGVPLSEYREAPEFIEQAAQGFVSGATAGAIPAIQRAMTGEEPIPATDIKGKVGAGLGELGGFVTGPAKLGGEVVTKTMGKVAPWLARALQATGQEGAVARTLKQGVREAVHLAPAIGLARTGQALERQTWGEAANDIAQGVKSGAATGAVFGVSRGLFPKEVQQRGRRIIAGLLGLNAQRTIEGHGLPTDRPLEDVVFDTAMDVFFLWHGLGARGLEQAEKDIKKGRKPDTPKPETPEQVNEAKAALYQHAQKMRLDDLLQYRDHPRVAPYVDVIDRVIAEKKAQGPKRTARERQADIDQQFGIERGKQEIPQRRALRPEEQRQQAIDRQWAGEEYKAPANTARSQLKSNMLINDETMPEIINRVIEGKGVRDELRSIAKERNLNDFEDWMNPGKMYASVRAELKKRGSPKETAKPQARGLIKDYQSKYNEVLGEIKQGRAILENDVTLKKDVFDKVEAEAVKVEPLTGKPEPATKERMTLKKGPGDIPTTKTPESPKGGPKIVYDDLPDLIDGYFEDHTNTIYISKKLSPERVKEVIRHELHHADQLKSDTLPKSKLVHPAESIKSFMEYFSDPQEVTARAAERGEKIPKIWNEVFRLRKEAMAGKSDVTESLKVGKIVPSETQKIVPDREIPLGKRTEWHSKRFTGQLGPSDPKPIIQKTKSIRIYLKNKGNGVAAETMLKNAGIEAFSQAPFSVDVPLNKPNLAAISDMFGVKISRQLPKTSRAPEAGAQVPPEKPALKPIPPKLEAKVRDQVKKAIDEQRRIAKANATSRGIKQADLDVINDLVDEFEPVIGAKATSDLRGYAQRGLKIDFDSASLNFGGEPSRGITKPHDDLRVLLKDKDLTPLIEDIGYTKGGKEILYKITGGEHHGRSVGASELERLGLKPAKEKPTPKAKQPWEMTEKEFSETAKKGKLHKAPDKKTPVKGQTPLSIGENEGYTPADIAHFYVSRRGGRVDFGREEYLRDAVFEGKPVPDSVLADYPDLAPKAEVKPAPGRLWYKDKQYPFKEFREIKGKKNKGKVRVNIGTKKVVVDKKDVTIWPESDIVGAKGVKESEVAYGSEAKAKERVSQIAEDAEQRYRDKTLSSEPVPNNAKDYTSKVARDYAEKGRIDYRGYKLRKGHEAEDIATMFQVYRSEKQEILHAIARDKSGKILAHTALTSGMIDSVGLGRPEHYLYSIKSWADRLGASKIDILHNHPAGTIEMSPHDKLFAFYLKHGGSALPGGGAKRVAGLGNRMGEFVVIDHGKFSYVKQIEPISMALLIRPSKRVRTADGKYKVIPSMNNWMFKKGVQVNSPDKVAAFAAGLKYDKNKVCVIYLDSNHQVQGWTIHNKTILMKSPSSLRDTIQQQTKAHDAKTAVVIADTKPLLNRLVRSNIMGKWLLDVQDSTGFSYREAMPTTFGLESLPQGRKAWRLFEPDATGAYEKDKSRVFRDLLDVIEKGERREARKAEPTAERKKGEQHLKDDFKAVVRGLQNVGVKKAIENVLKSPEWYDDPRQAEATKIAIERSAWFHENFNEFNEVTDPFSPFDTVANAMVALGRKGSISKTRFLFGKRSKEYKQLADILNEADIMQKVHTEESLRKKGIGKDVIHVWKQVRECYDKQLEAMQRPMKELIKEIEERAKMQGKEPVYPDFGEYIDKDGKRTALDLKEALMFMGQFKGSYAPRIRQAGNWVVQGKQYSGNYIREHRRSKIAAELLANKLRREGYKNVKVSPKEQILEETFQMMKVMEVNAALDRAMATGEAMTEYDADIRMALERDLLTSAADLIKSRGARSTMIRRRRGGVVTGYMTDPIERTIRYTSNNAAGMAKAKAAREMFRVLFGEIKNGKRVGGVDQAKEPQVHRALRKYIEEQLRNPDKADRAIGLAKSLATFKYLGFNPRSIMVNITSLATTAPVALHQYVLGGKGSLTKVLGELAKASKDYIKVMKGQELSDIAERRFIEEVRARGYTDPQYMREAIGHVQGAYGTGWSKAMGGSMWAFGKSEEWVRGGTALAGFRLARKAGMSEVEATKLAKTASDKAHGIYGKATLPAIAQGTGVAARTAQLMYVYAKFPHNALQMYYDVGIKKGNIKGFIYALAAPAVLGGAAAFPMKDTIIAFVNTMLKAIGIDRDAEKFVYDTIKEQLGEPVEKRVRGGILGEMGIDISGSLAMGPGSLPHELMDLTGAIGGVAQDVTQSWRFIRTGQPGRAAESVLPSVAGNILRATRELNGATTRRGYRIWDKNGRPYTPTKGETALRTVGFRSARRAHLAEETWHAKRERARFDDRRKFIYEKYRAYLMNPVPKLKQDVWDDIYAFNQAAIKTKGIRPITKDSIKRQMRRMSRPTARERRLIAQ